MPATGRRAPRALLLDLDGTLVDTAPDMAAALVALQRERGMTELPYEEIRPWVSHGTAAMIQIGFGVEPEAELFPDLRDAYLQQYADNLATHSSLFSGMREVLDFCEGRGIPWGVVTNKPGFLTLPLLQALDLHDSAACIVSGDSVTRSKPDPMPLLHACMLLHLAPSDCIYVGDAKRDIQAGQRAGTRTMLAHWGYLTEQDNPADWGAQTILEQPMELLSHLTAENGARA